MATAQPPNPAAQRSAASRPKDQKSRRNRAELINIVWVVVVLTTAFGFMFFSSYWMVVGAFEGMDVLEANPHWGFLVAPFAAFRDALAEAEECKPWQQ